MAKRVPTAGHSERRVTVGRIVSVHGVKGWVKVRSFTEPEENIVKYRPWWLQMPRGWRLVDIDDFRRQGKGLIAHIAGVDDRDKAALYCQRDIAVDKTQFPALATEEYYWHQLEGLTVVTKRGPGVDRVGGIVLGRVTQLLKTGANDVLVVKGGSDSLDRRERLIPYADQYISKVDLDAGEIEVDWDPEF